MPDTPIILWDNLLSADVGFVISPGTETGYDIANVYDWRLYTKFMFNAAGTATIVIDCGTPQYAGALAIGGHNLFTASASVKLEKSVDGISWITVLDAFNPTDDNTLLEDFTRVSSRYWRLTIISAAIKVYMGIIVLADPLVFDYPPDAPYSDSQEKIISESARSKAGYLLGAIIRYKELTINANFSNLSQTWIDTYFIPFWDNHAGNLTPFIWHYNSKTFLVSANPDSIMNFPKNFADYVTTLALNMTGIKE